MSDAAFFATKKPAAVLKHGILSRYMPVFAGKAGSRSAGRRVVVLDGYAGEGRYKDGAAGSPLLMANTASNMTDKRQIELHFVEANAKRFARLNRVLDEEVGDQIHWRTYRGDVVKHLDTVLEAAAGVPFFAFLDPCGLCLPFDDIVGRIFARPNGRYAPGTEVLINFSAEGARRIGGRLKEPAGAAGREKTLARMDAVCGSDWWRDISTSSKTDEEAAERIAAGYFDRLTRATGGNGWLVPVQNAYHHQAKYSLVFISRHPDGPIAFGDALSKALADWRRALVEDDEFLSDPVYFNIEEEALYDRCVREIKNNMRSILDRQPQFTVRMKYSEVMGSAAGIVREMHVRRAIKELHAEGLTGFDGVTHKGTKLWDQVVFRQSRAVAS